MGDKSPKAKSKQASQKQTKADFETQKKKDAASAKQIPKAKSSPYGRAKGRHGCRLQSFDEPVSFS